MSRPGLTVILGPEHDQALMSALRSVLLALGARHLSNEWAVGGSQERQVFEVEIGNDRLLIEAETYVGLSVTGPPALVRKLQAKMSGEQSAARPLLDRPRIQVDFNEMIGEDVVLISRDDARRDSSGTLVQMREGLRVYLYGEDADERGAASVLLATGIVEVNDSRDWSSSVRWCCRIDHWE